MRRPRGPLLVSAELGPELGNFMPALLKNVGCRGAAAVSTTLQLVEGTSLKFWAPKSARGGRGDRFSMPHMYRYRAEQANLAILGPSQLL